MFFWNSLAFSMIQQISCSSNGLMLVFWLGLFQVFTQGLDSILHLHHLQHMAPNLELSAIGCQGEESHQLPGKLLRIRPGNSIHHFHPHFISKICFCFSFTNKSSLPESGGLFISIVCMAIILGPVKHSTYFRI